MASEFLLIAETVLGRTQRSMSAREIVSFAMDQGLFSDRIAGRTPHQTMKSKLSQDIRKSGDSCRFVRTAPGRFHLRSLITDVSDVYHAPPYTKPASHEHVLAISRDLFSQVVDFQGLTRRWKTIKKRLLVDGRCEWIVRMAAEGNDAFKQVLTYVVVTRRGSVLCFKRGNYNRVESYLRGSRCVGFGGHVSGSDSPPLFPSPDLGVTECVVRELCEELDLPARDKRRLLKGQGLAYCGVLNDDSSAVGRRHFAFVFRYETSPDAAWRKPTRGEKSITQLQWLNAHSRAIPIWEFEYWSQLVLRHLFPNLVTTAQAYRLVRRKPLTPPHLLCVIGEVGSGKSETTQILRDTYGYEEINTGRVMAELLRVPPIPQTPREDFQRQAWEFIGSPNGPARLAEGIIRRVSQTASSRILIDGIRQKETFVELRRISGHRRLGLLYVFTPPDVAYTFYRARESSGTAFDDYLAIRNAPVEKEVPSMIALADGVLYNWAGRAFHLATVHSMCKDLGIERCKGQ